MANLRQKELARLAGVSQATVSRCLRNDLSQNPATRKRVLKLAKKMGYVPNSFAAGLASARLAENKKFHANLAIISGNPELDPTATWKAWELLHREARAQAERHGYSLEHFWRYAPGMTAKRLRRMVEARGIKGVILLMINPDELDLPWERLSISSVCVAGTWPARANYVGFDRYAHALTAFESFEKMGYRRPALAFYSPREMDNDRGANVAALQLYQRRLPPGDRLPIYIGSGEEFPKWVDIYRPDIIFSFYGGIIEGVWERIPGELGFVNLSGLDYEGMPDCSFLNARTDLAGIVAVDLVTGQLHRNERGWPEHPYCTLVPTEIYYGASTRDRRGSRAVRRRRA